MNIAVIFAGGCGSRMNTRTRPKQFLLLNGKPVLIYTVEVFEEHRDIDAIVVVCLKDWIPYLRQELLKFGIKKVRSVIPGGSSGPDSIFLGLCEAEKIAKEEGCEDAVVLIHDGVRPLIYHETITDNIDKVKECGSCITVVPATETVLVMKKGEPVDLPRRSDTRLARAPQSFYLSSILDAYRRSRREGLDDFVDSCSLMSHYGATLGMVEGPMENIKITTPTDYYLFRAMVEVIENRQIFGIN
jgi:2-C-methyl-D-erythritol 4-phosphate cytidylyltransferase 1